MLELQDELQAAVHEKYRLVRELTRGGMSRVFLAKDVKLERDVAIKVLAPELVEPGMVERFHNEVLQIARLQHPTIIPLIEVGAIGDLDKRTPFYVMPYARGESVRSRILHEGAFSVRATTRLLHDVLGALEYAHEQGLMHRDIKPENIYLSGSHAVLADFGIAKAIVTQRGGHAVTSPGETIGTPAYMAPEQLAADPATDHRADIYSLGVVAYELLTARLPWKGATATDRLSAQVRGEKEQLRVLRAEVPVELADWIDKCLAYNPSARPQSASHAMHLLDDVPRNTTAVKVITERMVVGGTRMIAARIAAVVALLAIVGWLGFMAWNRSGQAQFILSLFGFVAWLTANVSYAAMRAQRNRSAKSRALAFVLGFPGTLFSWLAVGEGSGRAYGITLPISVE